MAARIRAETGVGSLELPEGYVQQGNYRVFPGYDTAQNRVDLTMHGGVGRIVVQQ